MKKEGLTLIEVILSIALIGMIAIVFLTLFNTGNKNILKSGNRTEKILNIQEKVDEGIKNYDNKGDDEVIVTIEKGATKSIRGKFITEEQDGVKITTFIPNKTEGK